MYVETFRKLAQALGADAGSLLCREEKPDSGDRHIKSILSRMSRMEKGEQAVVAQTVNALADALEKNRQGKNSLNSTRMVRHSTTSAGENTARIR